MERDNITPSNLLLQILPLPPHTTTAAATQTAAFIVRSASIAGRFLLPNLEQGRVKRQGGGGGLLPPSAGVYLFLTSYRAFFCPSIHLHPLTN